MGSLGMVSPPPPSLFSTCHCGAPVLSLRARTRSSVFAPDRPPWMSGLADADFSKPCVADRVCGTCGGAAFCDHCCGEHHRGHDTAIAASIDYAAARRRDSFCTACRVAFSSELCAHHAAGHEVIPVVDHDRWYCARGTGSERWFRVFGGVQTFRDDRGNVLVPLRWKPEAVPDALCRAWVAQLFLEDFSEACVTDRVCNTCGGGAGFCEHCCGEHHRGHDTAAATNDTAAAAVHKRDSFCISCRVAFCSDLCAHHHAVGGDGQSHEVIPIDDYDGWHFARCTGSERWFLAAFGGIKTFRDKRGNVLVPLKQKAFPQCPSWFSKVVTADYSKTCTRDRVCNTCAGAGFCDHCCGEHHRGHDTAATAHDTAAATVHKRDSFCIDCRVAFASDLCAHHAAGGDGEGHEVMPIVEFDMWYCGRCTGSEWWYFTAFLGSPTFDDEHGNVLVLLRQREMEIAYPELGPMHGEKLQDGEECPRWMYLLLAVNFNKTCTRDRVCNTCGGAAFCRHCCGEHHHGHDTATAIAKEKDGSAASEGRRRDSFCIGCGVGFSSELCTHHAGHEVIPIDAYGDRHFVRSTGSESWFTPAAFGGIETFEDKDGNLMVPLERKMSMFPEPGLSYRYDTHHHGGTTTPLTAPTAEPMLVC